MLSKDKRKRSRRGRYLHYTPTGCDIVLYFRLWRIDEYDDALPHPLTPSPRCNQASCGCFNGQNRFGNLPRCAQENHVSSTRKRSKKRKPKDTIVSQTEDRRENGKRTDEKGKIQGDERGTEF
ncbi:unnamed protein product [Sphagnum balticum]